jgi:hypothetical protein
MASKKGRATFADLARRWAADRNYGASIEWVANSYRESFCHGPDPAEEAEPAPHRSVKRVAAVEKLPPAANLGGPTEADTRPAAKQAPVRTIWSAADGPTEPAATVATPEPVQDEAPAKVHAAPIPTRKPVAETAAVADPVVSEQIIQTGEETPPVTETPPAAAAEREPVTTAAAGDQPATDAPRAFAFAAAMSTARPAPSGAPKAGTVGARCPIVTASYGGKKILLVRSKPSPEVRFTVLTVLEGFEKSMLDSYLKAHAPGGSSVGEFASKNAAFAKARELCPSAAGAPNGEGANAG